MILEKRSNNFVAHKGKSTWWSGIIVWSAFRDRNTIPQMSTALTHTENKMQLQLRGQSRLYYNEHSLALDCNFVYQMSEFYTLVGGSN
jgi:hypothetical protein